MVSNQHTTGGQRKQCCLVARSRKNPAVQSEWHRAIARPASKGAREKRGVNCCCGGGRRPTGRDPRWGSEGRLAPNGWRERASLEPLLSPNCCGGHKGAAERAAGRSSPGKEARALFLPHAKRGGSRAAVLHAACRGGLPLRGPPQQSSEEWSGARFSLTRARARARFPPPCSGLKRKAWRGSPPPRANWKGGNPGRDNARQLRPLHRDSGGRQASHTASCAPRHLHTHREAAAAARAGPPAPSLL